MDRKYKQRGYADRDAQDKKRERSDRPPSGEPRPKQDAMGPRTPRMVGTVMRARCSSCGAVLMPGFDPERQMSALRIRAALLQAMRAFRYRRAIRVHPADPRAHRQERPTQRMHFLRVSHHG